MIRVRAYCADFRVTRKLQALAGHGDEFAVLAYPKVLPHFPRSRAKWTGLGQCSQLDHLRHICLTKFNEVVRVSIRFELGIILENHLYQSAFEHDLKSLRRIHARRKEQTEAAAGCEQTP